MRLLFVAVLVIMFFYSRAWAQDQEDNNVATATSDLQTVLSTLKKSVENLKSDNDQWLARDHALKEKLLGLQTQLGQLQAQGDLLNKTAQRQRLQDKNSWRSRQIARLEKENVDLDHRIQKAQAAIQGLQQSLEAQYQEDQKLLLRLKEIIK